MNTLKKIDELKGMGTAKTADKEIKVEYHIIVKQIIVEDIPGLFKITGTIGLINSNGWIDSGEEFQLTIEDGSTLSIFTKETGQKNIQFALKDGMHFLEKYK